MLMEMLTQLEIKKLIDYELLVKDLETLEKKLIV